MDLKNFEIDIYGKNLTQNLTKYYYILLNKKN